MRDTFKIDLGTIDLKSFQLKRVGDYTLITPLRGKETWKLDELHLRSVMVDADGCVVSTGFPKFFNYGEQPTHDAEFEAAVRRDDVSFPEKMDGSLIIIDEIDGRINVRTRGQTNLGTWEGAITKLIHAKYPDLAEVLKLGHPMLTTHSLLLEYVSPDNNIVLRYEQPELYFLALVDKATLRPAWTTSARTFSWQLGLPRPGHHVLPTDPEAVHAAVRRWSGKEGVVACFRSGAGDPMMLKIKAEEYLALHTFRGHLSPRRVTIACFLADVCREEEAYEKLAPFGFDYEAARFSIPTIREYLVACGEQMARLKRFQAKASTLRSMSNDKRDYVELVRAADFSGFPERWWFTVAMKLYDGGFAEAWPMVAAEAVLHESMTTVKNWLKDPLASFRAIVEGPAETEE